MDIVATKKILVPDIKVNSLAYSLVQLTLQHPDSLAMFTILAIIAASTNKHSLKRVVMQLWYIFLMMMSTDCLITVMVYKISEKSCFGICVLFSEWYYAVIM